jgi:hypothetical protein
MVVGQPATETVVAVELAPDVEVEEMNVEVDVEVDVETVGSVDRVDVATDVAGDVGLSVAVAEAVTVAPVEIPPSRNPPSVPSRGKDAFEHASPTLAAKTQTFEIILMLSPSRLQKWHHRNTVALVHPGSTRARLAGCKRRPQRPASAPARTNRLHQLRTRIRMNQRPNHNRPAGEERRYDQRQHQPHPEPPAPLTRHERQHLRGFG